MENSDLLHVLTFEVMPLSGVIERSLGEESSQQQQEHSFTAMARIIKLVSLAIYSRLKAPRIKHYFLPLTCVGKLRLD